MSRRAMLGALVAGAGLPLALGACGGGEGDEVVTDDGDVEDGVDLASAPAGARRPAVPEREPVVRVRVVRVRDRRGSARLGGAEQWIRLAPADDPATARIVRGPVRVRAGKGAWSLLDGEDRPIALDGAGVLVVESIDPLRVTIAVDGVDHPGRLRLVPRSSVSASAFDVVNDVSLESYLPGVVRRELFPHWHLEAFKAQAVAARSFAAAEHAYFSGRRHYDLTNTAHSQVYGGQVDHRRAIDAVVMTRGQVLEFQGHLVPGYYSSCCGGVSASAIDAIGENPINDVEPLRGRGREDACREAPVFSWSLERPAGDLAARVAAFGRRYRRPGFDRLGRIRTIEVSRSNPHGRPIRFAIVGAGDVTVEIAADELRRAANLAVPGLRTPGSRLKSSHFTATVERDTVSIRGYGFGHGVGLCQYGAEAHARAGKPWRQIVEWYYPEAGIRRAYG